MTVAMVRRAAWRADHRPWWGTTARAAHGGGAGKVPSSYPIPRPA